MTDRYQDWFQAMDVGDGRAPTTPDRDWLALRARAPMRQPAGKANRRRPRPEQNDVSGLALFEPPLV